MRIFAQVRHLFKDSPAVSFFAALIVAGFLLSVSWGGVSPIGGIPPETLDLLGGIVSDRVKEGEWWRLLASMFLHGSVSHFLLNVTALFFVGIATENILGAKRFILLFLASGLSSGLFATFFGSGRLTVGASGAIYGIMATLFIVTLLRKSWFKKDQVRRFHTLIALNFVLSLLPGVSAHGHLGGFVAGIALCPVLLVGRLD